MKRIFAELLLFGTPWRIAARQALPSRLRLVLTAWAVGLLALPALELGDLLHVCLRTSLVEGLSAPQVQLLSVITDGLMETQPPPAWAYALLGLGWLAGGLAAGLLGTLLHSFVLLGLSRGAPEGKRKVYALGVWGLGYTLVGVAGLTCWEHRSGYVMALAAALSLAASLGCGALGWGTFRLAGASRVRAGVNATLYGLVLWTLLPFVLEVAALLAWLPLRLVERLGA